MTDPRQAPPVDQERILVIKHGALGDLILALGPFAAIRRHHAAASVTLLTTPPFVDFTASSPYFDDIWSDHRPKLYHWGELSRLRRRLSDAKFNRIYDLQTSSRTGLYFRYLIHTPRPQWSGIAKGCSHPHVNSERGALHTLERQAEQLRQAGIADIPAPSLDWAVADLSRFKLPSSYTLIMPGGAPHRPEKRWPEARFASLIQVLAAQGMTPCIVGGNSERALAATLANAEPHARDLTGATNLIELAALARDAELAIGNDTGPMHVAATAGARSVVIFGPGSDPRRARPRGRDVRVVKAPHLDALHVSEVLEAAGLG